MSAPGETERPCTFKHSPEFAFLMKTYPGSAGTRAKRWFEPPLHVHCSITAPVAVDFERTSMHFALCEATSGADDVNAPGSEESTSTAQPATTRTMQDQERGRHPIASVGPPTMPDHRLLRVVQLTLARRKP